MELLSRAPALSMRCSGAEVPLRPLISTPQDSQVQWAKPSATVSKAVMGRGRQRGTRIYALLWSGTAASAVDIHPAGYISSEVEGLDSSQQVGVALPNDSSAGQLHAILWNGSAQSAIDLNPAGFTISAANGVANDTQVGYGSGPATGNRGNALLWNGSAGSVVDLQQFLPSNFIGSEATGIDSNGDIVGEGFDGITSFPEAIVWIPVPEPTTLGAMCLTIPLGLCRRRRNEWNV